MQLINDATRARLMRLQPEAAAKLAQVEQAIDDTALDPALLALAGAFIEASLRGDDWQGPAEPTDLERACLAFCDQFVASVANVTDEQVDALRAHLSPDSVYLFSNAVYLIDLSKRLELTLEAALP